MQVNIIFEDGRESLVIDNDGVVRGRDRRIRGALVRNRRGTTVDTYFTREVVADPAAIPWQDKDGSQRVFLYDDAGVLEGRYTVRAV